MAKSKKADAAPLPEGGVVKVTAKAERGRWRIGRHFTRETTTIPIDELEPEQLEALQADPDLSVSIEAAPTA